MVNSTPEHTRETPAKQGDDGVIRKPMKIGASTPYDFKGSNLTPYGGLFAPAFQQMGTHPILARSPRSHHRRPAPAWQRFSDHDCKQLGTNPFPRSIQCVCSLNALSQFWGSLQSAVTSNAGRPGDQIERCGRFRTAGRRPAIKTGRQPNQNHYGYF